MRKAAHPYKIQMSEFTRMCPLNVTFEYTYRVKWRHSNLWCVVTIRSLCCRATRRTMWT